MADYKSYSSLLSESAGEISSSEDGNYQWVNTQTYTMSAAEYARLLSDLQNQRDALASRDVTAEIAELDAAITEVSAVSAEVRVEEEVIVAEEVIV